MNNRSIVLEDEKPVSAVMTFGVYDPKEGFGPPKNLKGLKLNYVVRSDRPNSLCGILTHNISTILVYEFGSAVFDRAQLKHLKYRGISIFVLKVSGIEVI